VKDALLLATVGRVLERQKRGQKPKPLDNLVVDADGQPRPSMPLDMIPFGSHAGPGRYDVGAWEHCYYSP
jgi:hypothetical protein